jgi:hypothetical protein
MLGAAVARLRRFAHDQVHAFARRAGAALGYEMLWPSYYNGVPRFSELPAGFWEHRSDLPGVNVDAQRALQFLAAELGDGLREFAARPQPAAVGPGVYSTPNGSFDAADAATTWAMIRRYRPQRVLELGSGFSTLLIRDALAANGNGAAHTVVDPFPRADELGDERGFDVQRVSAAQVAPSMFEELRAGDVLFVDTTHTVKVGGEVNHIVLDGLPRLAPGVLVHVHDIFLPFEYPRRLVEGLGYHWAEQYLLQAFLAGNDSFEVLLPMHLLAREHTSDLERLLGVADEDASSFWLLRV